MPALCRACAQIFDAEGNCPHCGSERVIRHPNLLDLTIAHIDCDAFYASVEKRDRPELTDRPLIIGRNTGRGVVTTACYIARRFGPRSAMPMYKALELCPQATVIPPDLAKYRKVSEEIRALFRMATPQVEPLSLDEAYLDLSPGIRRIDRPAAVLLARLARAIETRIGITVSVGLSHNKFLAKLASDRDKPRGFSVIGPNEAASLLAPMPVNALWGVGEATAKRMEQTGLRIIADVQALPESALVARFGKLGHQLALMARGLDDRPIRPDRPVKSVSNETTFLHDIRTEGPLAEALAALTEKVAGRLDRAGLAGRTVVLKLKTSDFHVLTRHQRLADPTRRGGTILHAAQNMLSREIDGRAFRLIGVGITDLCTAHQADPPSLFDLLHRTNGKL